MFMETQNHDSKIDVRIIVGGLDIAQLVSKAVNNIQLENDYNIIVSSIIPTVELSIVKRWPAVLISCSLADMVMMKLTIFFTMN